MRPLLEQAHQALAQDCTPTTTAQATSPSSGEGLLSRALGLSAQILRQREGYYTLVERCERGDLDGTDWLIWFLEQLIAAAHLLVMAAPP